jgi:hypothetical protein
MERLGYKCKCREQQSPESRPDEQGELGGARIGTTAPQSQRRPERRIRQKIVHDALECSSTIPFGWAAKKRRRNGYKPRVTSLEHAKAVAMYCLFCVGEPSRRSTQRADAES